MDVLFLSAHLIHSWWRNRPYLSHWLSADHFSWRATLVHPVSGQLIVKLICTCLWGNYDNRIAILPLLLCCCAETQQNWSAGPGTMSESSWKRQPARQRNVTARKWLPVLLLDWWKVLQRFMGWHDLIWSAFTLFVQLHQCGFVLNLCSLVTTYNTFEVDVFITTSERNCLSTRSATVIYNPYISSAGALHMQLSGRRFEPPLLIAQCSGKPVLSMRK